jgi:hypothetical protein
MTDLKSAETAPPAHKSGHSLKRYDSMGFAADLGLWVRWADYDALAVRLAACESFVAEYIADEERSVAQWNIDFPKMPWKPDHAAMKRLQAARAALSRARGE